MKPRNNSSNLDKCFCINCQLYSDCNVGEKEKLFCGGNKTECPMDTSKICNCSTCPVYLENNLSGGYFCVNGLQ